MSGRKNLNKQEIEQPEAVFIFTPRVLLLFSLKMQTKLAAAEAAMWVSEGTISFQMKSHFKRN